MEVKKKSFEQFVEEEMAKSPEQIEREVISDPDYPKLTPPPEMREKLKARLAAYEAEQARKQEEHEKALKQILSDEELEALRRGKAEMALEESAREGGGNTEARSDSAASNVVPIQRKKKRKKSWKVCGSVAAAAVVVCTVGVTAMGGPEKVINTMTGTLGGREQVYVDTDDGNTLISGESEEEIAYQNIKDILGFDPVRLVYMPEKYCFKEATIDKELQSVLLTYSNGEKDLSYKIKANYIDSKLGLDIEDDEYDSYVIEVEGQKIQVKEYHILGSNEKEYIAQFTWRKVNYFLYGIIEKDEIDKIINNLLFV